MVGTDMYSSFLRGTATELWKSDPDQNTVRLDSQESSRQSEQPISLSEKSKIYLQLEKEWSTLEAQAQAVTVLQKEAHKTFVLRIKELSKHHEVVLAKMAAIEELLEKL